MGAPGPPRLEVSSFLTTALRHCPRAKPPLGRSPLLPEGVRDTATLTRGPAGGASPERGCLPASSSPDGGDPTSSDWCPHKEVGLRGHMETGAEVGAAHLPAKDSQQARSWDRGRTRSPTGPREEPTLPGLDVGPLALDCEREPFLLSTDRLWHFATAAPGPSHGTRLENSAVQRREGPVPPRARRLPSEGGSGGAHSHRRLSAAPPPH